ncbi:MAG: hypothetical protein ACQETH_11790 [Candidatus Rifleibacteriota bacterium]
MMEHPGKTVGMKKRVLSQIKNREIGIALKLYYKYFSQENPPDSIFVKKLYTELNKLNKFELCFRITQEASSWLPDEKELVDLKKQALKIYFNHLQAEGNRLLGEREEKAGKFYEDIKKADSLTKEKIREENEKILHKLILKALENFQKAYDLNNDSLGAINGLFRCYKILGDEKNISKFQTILEEKDPHLHGKQKQEEAEKNTLSDQEFDIEEFNIKEVLSLYDKNLYYDVIEKVDFLHLTHKLCVPLLLLKAESLVALKRFKEADKVLFEAEKQNTHSKDVRDLKNNITELKYNLLSKAGEIYLKKALELGPSLGKSHFRKARACLKRALAIFPDNLDLLDQQYTVLKYLKEDEQAFKTKALIYVLNEKYIPTFDKAGSRSLCFLASFAYARQPEKLNYFRWFRREILLQSEVGKCLNGKYVKYSPGILDKARNINLSPRLFRILLFPVLILIKICQIILKTQQRVNKL